MAEGPAWGLSPLSLPPLAAQSVPFHAEAPPLQPQPGPPASHGAARAEGGREKEAWRRSSCPGVAQLPPHPCAAPLEERSHVVGPFLCLPSLWETPLTPPLPEGAIKAASGEDPSHSLAVFLLKRAKAAPLWVGPRARHQRLALQWPWGGGMPGPHGRVLPLASCAPGFPETHTGAKSLCWRGGGVSQLLQQLR